MIKILEYYLSLIRGLRFPQVGDRDFKNKFRNVIEREIKYIEFKNQALSLILELVGRRKKEGSAPRVSQIFFEFFDKLLARYIELREIEWELFHQGSSFKGMLRGGRPIDDIQEDFVNKTESFHQAIYSSVSSFVKLLSVIAPEPFVKEMPSSKNSHFLKFIKNKIIDSSEYIKIIKRSTGEYRVKFIDHVSQHCSCDWYTFSNYDGKAYVVYFWNVNNSEKCQIDITEFITKPNKAVIPFKILTPFKVQKVFIPSHHKDTLNAFMEMTLKTLMQI